VIAWESSPPQAMAAYPTRIAEEPCAELLLNRPIAGSATGKVDVVTTAPTVRKNSLRENFKALCSSWIRSTPTKPVRRVVLHSSSNKKQ
jgi:hypothetical protein